MDQFESILKKALFYRPELNRERVVAAFDYANRVCGGIKRKSGDTVLDHVLAVVDTLLALRPDEETIIAALLHDSPKYPAYNVGEIKKLFGVEVANMVEAVNMLRRIKSSDQKAELESFRKMFLAIAKDVRVVLIKMADRLHNLEVSVDAPSDDRKLLAKETMDIYVPVSARLGIYSLKMSLEDWAFRYLYPQQYDHLKQQLDDYIKKTGKNIDQVKRELESLLRENNIEAEVEGRVKSLYSIYRKLKLKSHSTLHDLFDVFAMRVILPNKFNMKGQPVNDHLYAVLGLIHSKWTPLTNRFKDYVAVPKPNGYKSLHTAVVGIGNHGFQAVEIQIRTRAMHEQAEYGIASHWLYEDTKKAVKTFKSTDKRDLAGVIETVEQYGDWINELSKLQQELKNGSDVMYALKFDLFNDRIFVFTPEGDLKDLPQGASPIDFAYAVHSDVGQHCQVAKVNGQVVPLNYELQNGEVVEIITNNRVEPKPQWLAYVKTSGAKSKIRSYLKGIDQNQLFKNGKDIINKILEKDNLPLLDEDLTLLREYKDRKLAYKDRVSLVEEIGKKTVVAATVIRNILKKDKHENRHEPEAVKVGKKILPKKKLKSASGDSDVFIAGVSGLPHKFANCCKPRVGQPIIGYLTRGRAVSIHLEHCKVVKNAIKERIVEASWSVNKNEKNYPVKICLKAKNRVGLIRDIADSIASMNINIIDFKTVSNEIQENSENVTTREIVLTITDEDQFQTMMDKLRRVISVVEVTKAE